MKEVSSRSVWPSIVGASALANLKLIASNGWIWLTRLKRNRLVNPERTVNRPICDVAIASTGTVAHLKGYGFI